MPQQNISKIGIGTNDFIIKDETLTNNVTNLIEIISGNNNSIVNRINDLNNRAFDAEIKISSANETEISNIVDGLYKVKYITITGEGDNATETLNNSAILIQKGTNQYLIKDGQISSRTKTNDTWGNWSSTISLVLSPEYEISSASNNDLILESGDTYEEAFSKLEKTIYDNEYVISSALTDLNGKIEDIPIYGTTNKLSADYIENGSTNNVINVQANWNQTVATADDYIKNKPIIPAAQIQADWNQTATTSVDYIKNKPTIPVVSSTVIQNDPNPVSGSAVYGKFEDLIGAAPVALDTLQEIASALNNDADLAGTLTTQISTKIPKVSNPTVDNFASFNSDGTIKDSGLSASSFITTETQPDWNETATTNAAYIQNKPAIKNVESILDINVPGIYFVEEDYQIAIVCPESIDDNDFAENTIKYICYLSPTYEDINNFGIANFKQYFLRVNENIEFEYEDKILEVEKNVYFDGYYELSDIDSITETGIYKISDIEYNGILIVHNRYYQPAPRPGILTPTWVTTRQTIISVNGDILYRERPTQNSNNIEITDFSDIEWETSQADWKETDLTKPSYIKNKPELPVDYSKEYLTFVALEQGTFSFTMQAKLTTDAVPSMSYSTDNGETWTTVENIDNEEVVLTTPTIYTGNKVLWKSNAVQYATNPDYSNNSNLGYGRFSSTGEFNIEGNIMSLIYNNDYFKVATSFETPVTTGFDAGIFCRLFQDTQIFSAEHLKLPAIILTSNCYKYMFYNCTNLVKSPELPATTLASSCYNSMFRGCTSLVHAPELPATILANNCYEQMFKGCTSLVKAPELLATTLAQNCYNSMFYGCTRLVNAPQLPATTLATECYLEMFRNCTSLVKAPELLATTLAQNCYNSMFYGCTRLVNAPQLPATTLANNCYNSMFRGCTSLVKAPELPATTLVTGCYQEMFRYCSRLNYIKALFTTTLSSANTENWVMAVAASGTFVKNSSANWNERGVDGIPNGWNVYREDKYTEVKHYELDNAITPTNISTTLSTNKFTKINNKEINQILIPIDKSKNNYNGDLLSNTTIIPYISNAEKYLALQIGNVIKKNYIIVESNLIGNGFYSNTSILYNNSIAQIYPTLPLNLIKDNLQYLMLFYYVKLDNLFIWFDDYADGSTNTQDLDEWVTNESDTNANNWNDYVQNYLFEDYPGYRGANCYMYTGETYTWEGEEYYLWKGIITSNQEPLDYILTNTINYNELYNHSLESDSSNHWCPYIVKFSEDDNEYTAESCNDILIKVSHNLHVLQDAWILYMQNNDESWTDWDDYCDNYLLNEDEDYGNSNWYDYIGETYEWEGVEYYVWEHITSDYYILTDTIDYNELYNKSIEADHYNMNCPYVAMFDTDMQLIYNGNERKDDWLIKVIANNNNSNQAATILIDDFLTN